MNLFADTKVLSSDLHLPSPFAENKWARCPYTFSADVAQKEVGASQLIPATNV